MATDPFIKNTFILESTKVFHNLHAIVASQHLLSHLPTATVTGLPDFSGRIAV